MKINNANRVLYSIVISILGGITLASAAGIVLLSYFEKPVPESLTMLGSVSIGAIASLVTGSKE